MQRHAGPAARIVMLQLPLQRAGRPPLELRVRVAWGFDERLRGLMFRRRWPTAFDALLLPQCTAVHTACMGFAIDLLQLNGGGRVVAVVQGLRPWRLALARSAAACHTLELQEGAVARWKIRVGDRLPRLPALQAALGGSWR